MLEIALPALQIAWMGMVTTLFELTINAEYWLYETFWIGVCSNLFEACGAIPGIGPITDTVWGMIG